MKISHFAIKVKDIDQTIHFYEKVLGLNLLRRVELPENQGILVYLKGQEGGIEIELFQEGRKGEGTDQGKAKEEERVKEKGEEKIKAKGEYKEEREGGEEVKKDIAEEFIHFCLEVSDIESFINEVATRGADVKCKPVEVKPGLKIAFLKDPGGIDIEIMEKKIS